MSNETSLDRFLRNRAAVGLGIVDKRIFMIQRLLGGLFVAIGAALGLSVAMGAPADVAGGVLPLAVAGGSLVMSSEVLRRRFHMTNTSEWKLTPEAKGLLLKLVRKRNGWLDGGYWSPLDAMLPGHPMINRRARRHMRHIAWQTGDTSFGWFGKGSPEVSPEVVALLDVAAEQYNRIQGILQTPAPSSTLMKMAAAAIAAADEAMADVLHDCSALDRFPESASATRKQIESGVHALRELGDRLEDLATREQSITDKVDYSSRIDSVLEELRLEQMARNELQTPPENQQNLRA